MKPKGLALSYNITFANHLQRVLSKPWSESACMCLSTFGLSFSRAQDQKKDIDRTEHKKVVSGSEDEGRRYTIFAPLYFFGFNQNSLSLKVEFTPILGSMFFSALITKPTATRASCAYVRAHAWNSTRIDLKRKGSNPGSLRT